MCGTFAAYAEIMLEDDLKREVEGLKLENDVLQGFLMRQLSHQQTGDHVETRRVRRVARYW